MINNQLLILGTCLHFQGLTYYSTDTKELLKMVNPLANLMRVYQGPTVNIKKCASFTPFTEIVEKLVAIHKHNELARRVLGLDMRDDLIECGFRWGLFIITPELCDELTVMEASN